jgi:hypothetical protein
MKRIKYNYGDPATAPNGAREIRREALGRVAFSTGEAARALGKGEPALRRHFERHAVAENDEMVARLPCGIVARKRKGQGRWFVVIPLELRN